MTILDMLKTIFIGMAIAAPVGPISLLCIRTTLGSGFRAGFSAGLGSALADGIACLCALSCLEIISSSPIFSGPLLNYCAAAYLIYLGVKMIWHAAKASGNEKEASQGAGKSFVQTFLFTICNPLTLLSFAALFCSSQSADRSMHALLATAACISLGSAIWWLILAAFLSIARAGLGNAALKKINIGSALCILVFGFKLIFV
jgi:threonine/homoserine/homoserine lactone efflux protein